VEFLHELLRLEAPLQRSPRSGAPSQQSPPHEQTCVECTTNANHRCLSCFSGKVMCKGCLASCHANVPLHKIQVCRPTFITSYLKLTRSSHGMESFSTILRSPLLALLSTLGITLVTRVLPPPLAATSWSSTYPAFIVWSFVTAAAQMPLPSAFNSSVHAGFQQRLIDQQRCSPLTSLTSSASFKIRTSATRMTSIMPSSSVRMLLG
jgi:hypothetical protein